MERHALRDDQFARIENLWPGRPGTVGRNSELGNRLFVEAVIWKFRAGTPWRDLPERFGGWCNTHRRFSRWAVSGVSIGVGSRRRSSSQAIDLPHDGGVNLGRLFTPTSSPSAPGRPGGRLRTPNFLLRVCPGTSNGITEFSEHEAD